MKRTFFTILFFTAFFGSYAPSLFAQEIIDTSQGIWRARVLEITSETTEFMTGIGDVTLQQVKAQIQEGEEKNRIVSFTNDYRPLEKGDAFFIRYFIATDGSEYFQVHEINRTKSLLLLGLLFAGIILIFGKFQGVRSLVSLVASLLAIIFVLVPLLLKGYPPVFVSVSVASLILLFAIYFTHGFHIRSHIALAGTVGTVLLTGLLAQMAISWTQLSGFASEESVYLNFNTLGNLDFVGLLLGGIIIGVLGVLDDIAITQTAVVHELYGMDEKVSEKEVYKKALRVGKEHVGALVNTLVLAYVGVSLPLLLYMATSQASFDIVMNQEVIATEIVRTIVGSIGLIFTVPVTTFLAVVILGKRRKEIYKKIQEEGPQDTHGHGHSHL
ncbi:MAG: YibE/F family protein [Candidatus Pacebacteria bacterium]|nr:YibE/F family protein [Candidatus Paceibacterota bacterium]